MSFKLHVLILLWKLSFGLKKLVLDGIGLLAIRTTEVCCDGFHLQNLFLDFANQPFIIFFQFFLKQLLRWEERRLLKRFYLLQHCTQIGWLRRQLFHQL